MLDETNFQLLALTWIAIAILLVPIQLRITAPYGRHTRRDWGWTMNNRLAWILMEIVSPICFAYFFLTGSNDKSFPMWLFFGLWILHYVNRSIIFPFRIKTKGKEMTVMIAVLAAFFNIINGFLNGYWLGNLGAIYPESWLFDWRFIIGILLFITGFIINIHADNILIYLRKPGETDYKIPTGGLFKYISCPNHFGEILEWWGFALLCWNLPALSFAIWTAANLIPRALAHHRWYRTKFENYPTERQAVIPFVL
ncbi:MAG: DUF1295 domain-containing protein [Saprospiraceae bacterium]|nr:DUF1295 domain-containing protein [Saprospiraceae bacterium]